MNNNIENNNFWLNQTTEMGFLDLASEETNFDKNQLMRPLIQTRNGSVIPSQFLSNPKHADADKKSKNIKSHSIYGMGEEDESTRPHKEMGQLSYEEKKFLLSVERGDVATTRRMLTKSDETGLIDINCVDPLGRSALVMAIDNENLDMVELLVEFKVETKDALLHAISEEYVEAVELLLDHEQTIHLPGNPHSWEALSQERAAFTPDITPLILAAHRDNYEIIKILLDRGGTLPTPHELRCECDECFTSRMEDSLRHSRSRINAYRALASPSLIALSSKDPILTAFELSWELRRLSFLEHEFRNEYQELRKQCQDFATALLDHTRSSYELEIMLNHDPTGPPHEYGDRMQLSRLKLAVKLKQKKFVAHPNVQQLLASMWYEGLPGFRRRNIVLQALEIIKIGLLFPFFSIVYIVAPHSSIGQTMRKPFIKFICNSASYFTFLTLLILASQRIESFSGISEWFEQHQLLKALISNGGTTERGTPPSLVEWIIMFWVFGLIWSEIKQLWDLGLREYICDMWNVLDFITNAFYVGTLALRIVVYHQVQLYPEMKHVSRKEWDTWDPLLIAEGLFSAANIFSSLKLVYIFSVNPYLGPLQVSLSRMIVDILKFAFLYVLTLFAFSCGMNQLLWFYADLERKECMLIRYETNVSANSTEARDPNAIECILWRRFSNLFETLQTLFWAAFGLIDLQNFELEGIKPFTRFWGMLMFGTYSVINVIVLLNLLIAMMNHSYQLVSERADIEWKFARTKLWMSYFEEGETAPAPFNTIITPKSLYYLMRWIYRKFCYRTRRAKKEHLKTIKRKEREASERELRYQNIMRNLVRRYVTVEQRNAENQGVTEDDVNEIKQEISSFRCELVEILKTSGMNTSSAINSGQGSGGKKNRQKERRLMKGFNIGILNNTNSSFALSSPSILPSMQEINEASKRTSGNKLSKLAKIADLRLGKQNSKRRWGTLVEAAKNANGKKLVSKSRSEESVSSEEAMSIDKSKSAPYLVEEGTQTIPSTLAKGFSLDAKIKVHPMQSFSAVPIAPQSEQTTPHSHHKIKSFVNMVRCKAFSKPLSQSLNCSIEENDEIKNEFNETLKTTDSDAEEKANKDNTSLEFRSCSSTTQNNRKCSSPTSERCSISTGSTISVVNSHIPDIQYYSRFSFDQVAKSQEQNCVSPTLNNCNDESNASEKHYLGELKSISQDRADENRFEVNSKDNKINYSKSSTIQTVAPTMPAGWL